MKKKGINYTTAACCIALGHFALPSCNQVKPDNQVKPNVLFILADDLARHQVGAYGETNFYETPNIDRLAENGMIFMNAYAAAPVSSPTRASIMTGKYPARINLTINIPNRYRRGRLNTPPFSIMLSESEITMADILRENGYATGHFGKWHLNVNRDYYPNRPGDPESQGFDVVLHTLKPENTDNTTGSDWHNTDLITEHSISFIEKNKDQPFFCYVSYNAIHRPELERDELVNKYRAKPDADNDELYGYNNPVQAAMLETMDNAVGRIVDHIEKLGLSENTIIVFYSENGQLLTDKASQGFRGSKADLYEGGIRMPLIISWNNNIKPGSVNNDLVISNDFYPTFCETAGIDDLPKNIDGVSLVPLFEDPGSKLEREAIFWHFPHYHHLGICPQGAVRKGRYKLIENFEESLYNEPGGWELFDLENDPRETTNLVDSLPDVTEQLRSTLQIWRRNVGAQMMTKNPYYRSQ